MQHWYVYHSKPTMNCDYASLGEAAAYSKKAQTKILLGDAIWVVEGPGDFYLVDCFVYSDTDYPPLQHPFTDFKFKAKGTSLLGHAVPLTSSLAWFEELHARYITKQRLFARIESSLVDGFVTVSGISP